jgi:hypothetical protein
MPLRWQSAPDFSRGRRNSFATIAMHREGVERAAPAGTLKVLRSKQAADHKAR